MSKPELPLHVYRFAVSFIVSKPGGKGAAGKPLARGAFSEITGLEATMEPFSYREGGRNRGQAHFAGRTSFSTVILKRGFTRTRDLWSWFDHVNKSKGAYANRMDVIIDLQDAAGKPVMTWTLRRALPVKIKLPDLNATGQDVGVEELHLVFEDLEEKRGGAS